MDSKALDALVHQAIVEGVFPGACYAVGTNQDLIVKAAGCLTYGPDSPEATTDTLWDLASLTKVVGTTSAAMALVEAGKLDLDAPVAQTLAEFAQNGKEAITFRNLLLHNSGLAAFRPYQHEYKTPHQVLQAIYSEKLEAPPGHQTVYSDLGIVTLGKAIERIAGVALDQHLQNQTLKPLKMENTFFNPGLADRKRAAPTEPVEPWRTELRKARGLDSGEVGALETFLGTRFIRGEVHDPTAMLLGGVAGHAGLFSTIGDLVLFARHLLERDRSGVVGEFTSRHSQASTRTLGWDTNAGHSSSAGKAFSETSFGHTGFTGTSIWIDPGRARFAILLTNRVHPTASNSKIIQFRPRFHAAASQAVG